MKAKQGELKVFVYGLSLENIMARILDEEMTGVVLDNESPYILSALLFLFSFKLKDLFYRNNRYKSGKMHKIRSYCGHIDLIYVFYSPYTCLME